ncbi:hypothetical protein BU24DRAFT_417121 [Aaosphaeria arxii CBS 175.79]|uniref:Uncharacterized protein n=1 Tax=Aaosphaeria arxii CBS 175.79 TaxID=1450172 RepID=A0A6A5Y7E5_9PLEO|nr:uncharacterized protein BU24DRAFT_417121 [Aaosphaeria arxii CBS 175.79]KAF2021482.1 hypothetical protein BU24DRAFT_417121 [Aaosphaeria arxii CBS 175.79]
MEDVELFDIFVTWLYCSTMRFSSGSSYSLMDIVKEWKSANNRTVNDCDGTLMQLHYFGKLYHIPNLQRDALDALHDWYTSSNMPSPQWSTLVDHYIAAPKASLLRQMLVDVFCRYHIANIDIMVEESTLLMEAGMEFQAAAFRRYSQVMSKVMGGSLDPMYDLNLCVYHEHANVQEREQCPRRSQKYDKSVYPGIV